MKNSRTMRNVLRLVLCCAIFGALATLPLLSSARSSNSVTIVNNSSRTIRYVYVSHVDVDDWSGNQLSGDGIASGQSATVDVSCDQQQIKVIGEDQDGCFLSMVVACGSNSTWTITNDTAADCGQ